MLYSINFSEIFFNNKIQHDLNQICSQYDIQEMLSYDSRKLEIQVQGNLESLIKNLDIAI